MKCSKYKVAEEGKPYVFWAYRNEAFVWDGDKTEKPNFFGAALQLKLWMERRGDLSVLSKGYKGDPLSITNPYSYNVSTISILLGEVINACHDCKEAAFLEEADVLAVKSIRLLSELVIYSCRFFEAYIKQLLHLTSFSVKDYEGAALGALLSMKCSSCNKNGAEHLVKMLGSLAYRYRLHNVFETQVFQTMKMIKKLRDKEAAHASAGIIDLADADVTMEDFLERFQTVSGAFYNALAPMAALETEVYYDLILKCPMNEGGNI